jgi:hypothetical protein
MHHAIIRIHANCTPAKSLVTHGAVSVFINHNSAVQTAWHDFSIAPDFAVAQQHRLDDGCLFYAS